MRFVPVLLASSLMVMASTTSAQQRGQSPTPSAAPSTAQTSKPAEAGAPFTYNPEGRRDPFVSLVGRGNDPKAQGVRPPGVPGLG